MSSYVECGEHDDPVLGGGYRRVCRRRLHHAFPCSEVPDPPEPETPAVAPSVVEVEVEVDEVPVGEVLPFPAYALRRLLGGRRAVVAGRRRAL